MWSSRLDSKPRDIIFESSRQERDFDLVAPQKRKSIKADEIGTVSDQKEELNSLKQTIDVLKDEIHRLNVELNLYQMKYPPLMEEDKNPNINKSDSLLHEDDPVPPWFTNTRQLSPLFLAYDERLKDLNDEINQWKQEYVNSQNKAKLLLQENEQLRQQIKRSLEDKIRSAERDEVLSGQTMAHVSQDKLDEYKERLGFLQEENDVLLSLQSNLQEEIDNLRNENKEREALKSISEESKERLRELSNELESVNRQKQNVSFSLVECQKLLQASQRKEDEYRTELKAIKEDYNVALLEQEKLRHLKEDLFKRIHSLEATIDQHQQRFLHSQRQVEDLRDTHKNLLSEIESVRKDREILFESSLNLQKRYEESQYKEAEALRNMIEALEKLEDIRLDKEQAENRERQLIKEVSKLTEKLQSQKQAFEQTIECQVNAAKLQNKKQINSLSDELRVLEVSTSELRAQLERAFREKRAIESELEKAKSLPNTESARLLEIIEELRKKAGIVERDRDEYLQKAESVALSERKFQNKLLKDKAAYEAEISELQRKVKGSDLDKKEELRTFQNRLEDAQRENILLRTQRDDLQYKYNQELTDRTKQHESIRHELESKLEETKKNLLRVSEDSSRLQTLNETLQTKVALNSTDNSTNMEKNMESQRQLQYIQTALDRQSSEAADQISSLLHKESELLSENANLFSRIDSMAFDNSKLARELDAVKRELTDFKSKLKFVETERSTLQMELKTTSEASNILSGRIMRLEDRLKAKTKAS
jgi:chromosome segregation ATPase